LINDLWPDDKSGNGTRIAAGGWAMEGEVLVGPADRPLTRYQVAETEGEIVVLLPGAAR
jgi:hypothetical protein